MNITYTACLNESLETCEWMRFVDTSPSGSAREGTLDELLQEAVGQKLLLILPAVMVGIMQTRIAARSDKQFLAALPFALEEELADDVEQLHFSVIERSGDGDATVAVTEKQLMETLFSRISQFSYSEVTLLPETLLLPCEQGDWSLLVDDARCVLCKGDRSRSVGYGFDTVNLNQIIDSEASLATQGDAIHVTVHDFRHEPAQLPQLDPFVWSYRDLTADDAATARLMLFQQRWIELDKAAHNLLQGEYRIRQEVEGGRRHWAVAAGLAGLSLILGVAGNSIENSRLETRLNQLETEMRSIYAQTFPNETASNRPVSEMRTRLAALKRDSGSGDTPFLDYLVISGPHLRQLPPKSIELLKFHHEVMEIDVRASSIEAIEELQQKMQAEALNVELKAITSKSGVVRGRIVVSGEQKT